MIFLINYVNVYQRVVDSDGILGDLDGTFMGFKRIEMGFEWVFNDIEYILMGFHAIPKAFKTEKSGCFSPTDPAVASQHGLGMMQGCDVPSGDVKIASENL